MNDIEKVNHLFESIYSSLKLKLGENRDELERCLLFKQPPATSYLPHIQMELVDKNVRLESRDYAERKFPLEISIEIYTEDTGNVPRRELAQKIESFVFDFLSEEVGLAIKGSFPIPNLDTNVHRLRVRYTGIYDINTNIIYKE